jgi:hypothetical protein
MLEQTELPAVIEGPHRAQLKRQLLEAMNGAHAARRWRLWPTSPWMSAAAACLIAMLLVATGWAAERVYEKVMKHTFISVDQGPLTENTLVTPDGHETHLYSGSSTMVDVPEGQDAQAALQQHQQQTRQLDELIARKKYKLLKTFEDSEGQTQYVYHFDLPEGGFGQNFEYPLDKVGSLKEYEQKVQEMRTHRQEQIRKAVAAGRYRLLDLDVSKTHVCREVKTGQDIQVQQVAMPDGQVIALVMPTPLSINSGAGYQMSWADHLRAIVDGTRELNDIRIVKSFTYELTLDDGSKTKLTFGGDEGLGKAPGAKAQPASRPSAGH